MTARAAAKLRTSRASVKKQTLLMMFASPRVWLVRMLPTTQARSRTAAVGERLGAEHREHLRVAGWVSRARVMVIRLVWLGVSTRRVPWRLRSSGAAEDGEGEVRRRGIRPATAIVPAVQDDGAVGLGQVALVVDADRGQVHRAGRRSVGGEGLGEGEDVADVRALVALGAEVVEREVAGLVACGEDERARRRSAGIARDDNSDRRGAGCDSDEAEGELELHVLAPCGRGGCLLSTLEVRLVVVVGRRVERRRSRVERGRGRSTLRWTPRKEGVG